MPNWIISLVTFIIGLMVGYLARYEITDALDWISDNTPVMCGLCKKIVRRKHSYREFHRVNGPTVMCEECWRTLYECTERKERP